MTLRGYTIGGDPKSLADYGGRTLLIVNTASRCGFTPQYASLEALYQRYKDRGFEMTRESGHPGAIKWNFTKFLVGPDGSVIARFGPFTDPLDRSVTEGIASSLSGR